MSWQVYENSDGRWCGYGVPAICDHPTCSEQIDRGVTFVCGDTPGGGDHGCGLYFCADHMSWVYRGPRCSVQLCVRCEHGENPFEPKADTAEWVNHMLTDESWGEWRELNPDTVAELAKAEGGQ